MAEITEILGQQKPLEKVSRIIDLGKRGQAVLLTGPVGIGKYALGLWMARRFLCEKDFSGCGECFSCRSLKSRNHPDYLLLFPFPNLASESKKHTLFHFCDPVNSDARYSDYSLEEVNKFLAEKSADPYRVVTFEKKPNIPAEIVRDLIRAIGKRPMMGSRRVVMVCELERMAFGAADLFLKTVEEPPEDTLIVLTSAAPHKLLPTLLSRTVRIPLNPVGDDTIKTYLEKNGVSDASNFYIRNANGSPGLALKGIEDDLLTKREAIWKIIGEYIENRTLPKTIDTLRRRYRGMDFDDVRSDFILTEKMLRDIYIAKFNLDNDFINIDIKTEIIKVSRLAPPASVMQKWFESLAKASRVHEINNVAPEMAFIGMFIEFDRAQN